MWVIKYDDFVKTYAKAVIIHVLKNSINLFLTVCIHTVYEFL